MKVKSYRELIVWQKAMELVEEVYNLCQKLPAEEIYGLNSQLKRASISIPSNIAEGQARQSSKEFKYFLTISRGSNAEVETQLEIGFRLGYFTKDDIRSSFSKCEEISKMLNSLVSKL